MRLIDADALLEVLRVREDEWNTPDETWRPEREYGNAIKNAPTIDAAPRWIPCSERLPELRTECLITFLSWSGYPVIDIDSYDYDGEDGWFSHMDKVIAWMPLPEPYEAREDNEGC